MSEIEKLYNIARIPKYGKRQCKDSEYLECQKYCFCDMHNKCDKFVVEYPPFTAEKQLEFIKFLSWHFEYGIKITKYLNGFSINNYTGSRCSELSKTFDESLASIVNKIWQDLTEEEKQQIKEIIK